MWGDQTSVPEDLIARMAAAGMAGLEVDHTDHTPEQRERYRAVADRLGLIATGGSDCHGTRYDPIRMGSTLCPPEGFGALRALVAAR
jgi:predicted metal-dependent phosphoesterase TrpH